MNIIDIILVLAIAAVVIFAVRHTIKTRRSGGCGCGCSGCNADCPSRTHRGG